MTLTILTLIFLIASFVSWVFFDSKDFIGGYMLAFCAAVLLGGIIYLVVK